MIRAQTYWLSKNNPIGFILLQFLQAPFGSVRIETNCHHEASVTLDWKQKQVKNLIKQCIFAKYLVRSFQFWGGFALNVLSLQKPMAKKLILSGLMKVQNYEFAPAETFLEFGRVRSDLLQHRFTGSHRLSDCHQNYVLPDHSSSNESDTAGESL